MGLWDYIMLGGWAAMYRVALTILSYKEKELLVMDLDEVGKTMREWKGTQIIGGIAAPAPRSPYARSCGMYSFHLEPTGIS